MSLYLSGLPPQNPRLQSNYEKNFRQISLEGQPTKYLSYLQNVLKTLKVFKYKEVLRNCPGPLEDKKDKTMEIPRKGGLWLIIMYPYWFVSCDNCIIPCKLLITGETGSRAYRSSLYYLHSFSVNLKLF